MKNEKIASNYLPLSYDLQEEMQNALDSKGNILLFLNKKKETGHVFCKTCKHSQFLEKQPIHCPECHSPDIFWNTLNINSLSEDVQKLFPKNTVSLITNNHLLPPTSHPQPNIDIGTAVALYAQQIKKYDLIGHIQTDSLINLADYTSGERLFAQITQLKKLASDKAKLILQTYNSDNPIFPALESGNYLDFYHTELKQRKLLSYPPFTLLVKLTISGKSDEKAKKQADTVFSSLSTQLLNYPTTQLLGPFKPIFWQGQPTYHIILKSKLNSYSQESRQKTVESISKLLEKGSKKYTIEVEPEGVQ